MTTRRAPCASLLLASLVVVACDKNASDGGPDPALSVSLPTAAPQPSFRAPWLSSAPSSVPLSLDAGVVMAPEGGGAGDPLKGRFTLAEALQDLPGSGLLVASIDTSSGRLECRLFDDKAPNTVANFVGLARGLRPFRTPSGEWVRRPAYDGTKFHRVVARFMIQGGDWTGTGRGEAGYTIADEIWAGSKHDRAGQLCMANPGKNAASLQFFITDGPAPHLDGGYTIFGECTPVTRVHEIANGPADGERATSPTVIRKVTVARVKPL